MVKLTKEVQKQILAHAEAAKPQEACGFIVKRGRKQLYVRVKNVAENPNDTFELDPDAWTTLGENDEVVAVVHSHPNGEPFLSGADRQMQVKHSLNWVLAVNGTLKQFRPCPHLLGRTFEYGVRDCGTLIRDAMMLAGLNYQDFERGDLDEDAANEIWVNSLTALGAKRISDGSLQAGDVILTVYGGKAAHAAMYIGNDKMLHHSYGNLSRREYYSEYWQLNTHSVWRFPEWQPEMLAALEADFQHSALSYGD